MRHALRKAGPALVAAGFLLPTAALGLWGYAHQRALLRDRAWENLEAVVFYKARALQEWHGAQVAAAARVVDLPEVRGCLDEGPPASDEGRARLRKDLAEFARDRGFAAASLTDPNGKSLPWSRTLPGWAEVPVPGVRSAATSGPDISPFFINGAGACEFDIIVPLAGAAPGSEASAVALALDPYRNVFKILNITSGPVGIPSLRVTLLQREGKEVVSVMDASIHLPPLGRRAPFDPGTPEGMAVQGDRERGESTTGRPTPVLFVTGFVPYARWSLLATMDRAAAFADLAWTAKLLAAAGALSLLAAFLYLSAAWERRRAREQADLVARLREKTALQQETVKKLFLAHETERRNLSRDLHDQVGQLLSGARLYLRSAAEHWADLSEEERRDLVQKAREANLEGIRECRAVVARLRPPELKSLGFTRALENWVLELAAFPVELTLEGREALDALDDSVQLSLYRIAQEAITNARNHSGAPKATLRVTATQSEAALEVRDEGRGFPSSGGRDPGHYGLSTMQERMDLVGGTLTVQSAPGGGTTVRAVAPILRSK